MNIEAVIAALGGRYDADENAVIERVFETGEPGAFAVEAYADGVETAHYRTRVVAAAPVMEVAAVTSVDSSAAEDAKAAAATVTEMMAAPRAEAAMAPR